MKRTVSLFMTALLLCTLFIPAYAAENSSYYPISVEEYTAEGSNELRIRKVYQLSLSDDPSQIPTEDFERDGRTYRLLDITRKDEVGVDTRPHIQTVTQPSDTNSLETILQRLDAEMEVTTEDGYSGTLRLDHTTVQVTTDGYKTKTSTLSASRSYPNLSEADLSLIPKTIEDKGRTLTLADVNWSESVQTDGEGNPVTRYAAAAKYTGTASSKYATGYTVSANYTGEVAKTGCDVVTYTAVFGSGESAPAQPDGSDADTSTAVGAPADTLNLKRPLMIGGLAVALTVGGVFVLKKIRRR